MLPGKASLPAPELARQQGGQQPATDTRVPGRELLGKDRGEGEGSDGLAPALATTKLWQTVEQKPSPPK